MAKENVRLFRQHWEELYHGLAPAGDCGKPYNWRQNSTVSWPWRISASCASLLCSHETSCCHTSSCKRSWKTAAM